MFYGIHSWVGLFIASLLCKLACHIQVLWKGVFKNGWGTQVSSSSGFSRPCFREHSLFHSRNLLPPHKGKHKNHQQIVLGESLIDISGQQLKISPLISAIGVFVRQPSVLRWNTINQDEKSSLRLCMYNSALN